MSTRPLPEPRPALRRAQDGTIHPAAPSQSSLAVDVGPLVAQQARRGGKPTKQERKRDAEEHVTVEVALPRSSRKKLRRRAESYGWSVEEAAAHVLRVWADG
jgi:hypothetical protein